MPALPRRHLSLRERNPKPLNQDACHFGPSLISIFGLFYLTRFITDSHMFTVLFSLAPYRLMLAELISPHGSVSFGLRCRSSSITLLGYQWKNIGLSHNFLFAQQSKLTTSCRKSGSRVALPPSRPLRTVRASFPAYGSSTE